eukprot:scaffold68684_cov19-Tisochrysis_lutea.AAC.1
MGKGKLLNMQATGKGKRQGQRQAAEHASSEGETTPCKYESCRVASPTTHTDPHQVDQCVGTQRIYCKRPCTPIMGDDAGKSVQ